MKRTTIYLQPELEVLLKLEMLRQKRLPRGGYARVVELNRQFGDLQLGFVDAAIVALAEALGVSRVATTDRRHFAPLAAALSLQLLP